MEDIKHDETRYADIDVWTRFLWMDGRPPTNGHIHASGHKQAADWDYCIPAVV